MDAGVAIEADAQFELGIHHDLPGLGIGHGAVGGEIEARDFPARLGVLARRGHPAQDLRGFQQRFAAEKAQVQNAAGREAAPGPGEGGGAHFGRHGPVLAAAAIAIITAQITGVIHQEGQPELLVQISHARETYCFARHLQVRTGDGWFGLMGALRYCGACVAQRKATIFPRSSVEERRQEL